MGREDAPQICWAPLNTFGLHFGLAKPRSLDYKAVMQLLTARDVIAELGGTQGVSTLTGSKPGAISNWRTGNWFPTKFHLLMTSALERRGYTAPASLWRVPEYD